MLHPFFKGVKHSFVLKLPIRFGKKQSVFQIDMAEIPDEQLSLQVFIFFRVDVVQA